MDKYKKLKAVQGLIISLDEQIYRYDQKDSGQVMYDKLTNQYYDAILELLISKEKQKEDTDIPEVTDIPSDGEPHTRG